MAVNTFIKATKVAAASLGVLQATSQLLALVWRHSAAEFTGAKDDTISTRVPAYAPARTRALRATGGRTKDTLHETKVDVTLDVDIYKDVGITDAQLELDIEEFGEQVLMPVLSGMVMVAEQEIAGEISGTDYGSQVIAWDGVDPHKGIVLPARKLLNLGNVPQTGRTLIVGADLEVELLSHDKFVHADKSGSDSALREAVIGRIGGFEVLPSNLIPPDEAYGFHRTAFAAVIRAPAVPAGAPWGASQSFDGYAIRVVRVFDPDLVEDRFVADTWIGVNAVTDVGSFDESGRFVPATDPSESGMEPLMVRAVQIVTSS